ncbi:putative methyltransferase-domain-containing protein [Auriculariales sp. MPI-PUGE-AT-0066]|nr:putative methyltransferase-domain-containing protein [Auriculariales sp. MPI-PUGE-AT-0066]
MAMSVVTPAHKSKDVSSLVHTFAQSSFVLVQSNNGATNGTTLWLAGQALAFYFSANLKIPKPGTIALELGSGIGLTALAVACLGFTVLATDIPLVHDTVLARNIVANAHAVPPPGTVSSRVLDWLVPFPDSLSDPPPALVFTADTLYAPHLITPLLQTLHAASLPARAPCYLCIERRDPALVDAALRAASDVWHFTVTRIPHKKLIDALRRGGVDQAALSAGDWADLEIWKFTHPKTPPLAAAALASAASAALP